MGNRLIGTRGIFRGAHFFLVEGELLIGREPGCHIKIGDVAVSRRHCRIWKDGQSWQVEDLQSSNGTLVNGRIARLHTLHPGDVISLGDHSFIYLDGDSEGPDCVEWDSSEDPPLTTIRIAPVPPGGESWRGYDDAELPRLVGLAQCLSLNNGFSALQHQVLQAIVPSPRSTRGAIIMLGDGPEDVRSIYGATGITSRKVHISTSIVKKVYVDMRAILWSKEDPNRLQAESLRSSSAVAVMSAPLMNLGSVSGVIYVESEEPIDERAMLFLSAAAAIVAQPLMTAMRSDELESENRRLRSESSRMSGMIGRSAALQRVHDLLPRLARADSTVLIVGESGTGKELAARAIHEQGRRSTEPFVAINCAAIAESLLESELFGHERGAFTGAVAQKQGKLELAGRGTVFLDEIGELGLTLQAKLLRVIQEREMERVGGTRSIPMTARIVAATNRDLSQQVATGQFRADLFYRLNVVTLKLPPLRDRAEDILPLAEHFLDLFSSFANRTIAGISPRARRALKRHQWPGNIRELRNAMERAVVLGQSAQIEFEDLPEELTDCCGPDIDVDGGYHDLVRDARVGILRSAMQAAGADYQEAAKRLRINVKYLHRLLRAYDLKD